MIAEGGQIRKSDLDISHVADLCEYKSKTSVYTHLEACLMLNWIGTDGEWYFIRSFDRLRAEYGANKRTAVELRPEDISKLDQFLLGSKINSIGRSKRHVRKIGRYETKAKKEPYSCLHGVNKEYQPEHISCSLIAKWFGFSPASATRLKQRARRSGYLNYYNRTNKLDITTEEYANLSDTMVPESHLTTYMMNGEQYIAIRLTDAFAFGDDEHNYHLKTRRAI